MLTETIERGVMNAEHNERPGDGHSPGDLMRAGLRRVMEAKGIKAHPWAVKAGVSSGSLYALLRGESDLLAYATILKLANAAGVPPSAITGEEEITHLPALAITHCLRNDRVTPLSRPARHQAPAPHGERQNDLRVAEIQGGSIGLLQEGTFVYWHEIHNEDLPRGLSIVTLRDGGQYLGKILGPPGGPYTLLLASGSIMDDVKIAHASPVVHIIPA